MRTSHQILLHHVAAAIGHLTPQDPGRADVHAARKEIKRARAILRLIRSAIGGRRYAHEDRGLRAAAHALNAPRDAEVLLATFETLRRQLTRAAPGTALAPLQARLLGLRRSAARRSTPGALAQVRARLAASETRIRRWTLTEERSVLRHGIRKTYRKGRHALAAARTSVTDERLHAWRKQAKYTLYQLETLPRRQLGKLAKRFDRLTEHLGDDHDLALLATTARRARLEAAASRTVATVIRQRRAGLQNKAYSLGEKLYGRSPRRLAIRCLG